MSNAAQEHLKQFAQNLYRLRTEKGWSQSELARRVWGEQVDKRGYTVARNRDLISVYEKGRAKPTRDNLDGLAKALGVQPTDLAPGFGISAVERDNPEFEMTLVPNDPTRAVLRINKTVSITHASAIIAMLAGASPDKVAALLTTDEK
jgi:transcriptional regulator with XRE-family HTH domain